MENYLLEVLLEGFLYWHRSNVLNDFKDRFSKIIMLWLYGNNPEEKFWYWLMDEIGYSIDWATIPQSILHCSENCSKAIRIFLVILGLPWLAVYLSVHDVSRGLNSKTITKYKTIIKYNILIGAAYCICIQTQCSHIVEPFILLVLQGRTNTQCL